jgi:hypothetical protein
MLRIEDIFDLLGHGSRLIQQTLEKVICIMIVQLSYQWAAPVESYHLIDTCLKLGACLVCQ